MDARKLSIVVPCYNERDTVIAALERVLAVKLPDGWEREVLVVDDASTDGTRDLLSAAALPVRVVLREANGGKGSALVDGFGLATGTHLLIQDADLEYDPQDIPELLSELAGPATAVYGSRNLRPHEREGSYILRAGVWLLTKVVNILYGARLTDVCTCYKVFPREAAPLFPPGRFEPELIFTAALLRGGYAIREIPISYTPRSLEEGKKISYGDGLSMLWAIFADYWQLGRSGIMPTKQ